MRPVTIRLPWPDKALNAHAKGNWRPKARATKSARGDAFFCAKAAGVRTDPTARLVFTFHPPDMRRRDVHAMPSMLKASIDGIADAMGCDDNQFRVAWPETWAEPVKGGCVLVTVGAAE